MIKKNITRKDLAVKIYKNLGFSKNFSLSLIDDFFEILISELINKKKIKISSFVTFVVNEKKERRGRKKRERKEKKRREGKKREGGEGEKKKRGGGKKKPVDGKIFSNVSRNFVVIQVVSAKLIV